MSLLPRSLVRVLVKVRCEVADHALAQRVAAGGIVRGQPQHCHDEESAQTCEKKVDPEMQATTYSSKLGAAVSTQRLFPAVQAVQKAVEVAQVQDIDKIAGAPVVLQRQVPISQSSSDSVSCSSRG